MQPHETASAYDKIAVQWDAKRHTSSYGLHFLERAIAHCDARDRTLDIGCGSGGRLMQTLLDAGFAVTGLDVSTEMLRLAKAKHPTVEFVQADVTNWTTETRYDLIVGWDSLFHLPYSSHSSVLHQLCGALYENGVLLFTAGGLDGEINGEMYGQRFDYSSLSDVALMQLLSQAGLTTILLQRDQYPLHHVVILATKRPSLSLTSSGQA